MARPTDVPSALPDLAQLSVEAPSPAPPSRASSRNPSPPRSPPPAVGDAATTVDASIADTSTVDASTIVKAPKPDGPKRSDPFQFGSRFLLPGDDVFDYNAWDHVDVDEDYLSYTAAQIRAQRAKPVSAAERAKFMTDPSKWWNKFYAHNRENFFKDRKWLQQEFPVLSAATTADAPAALVVELGCGAGNTLFPVLQHNRNPRFHIHGADFAPRAVELVREHELFLREHPRGTVSASVYDLAAADALPDGIAPGSVDVVIMVFVFSALAPDQWARALANLRRMLKPGGKILFRDYGRGDLAQVRFKAGRYLDENFYVRGDGTCVYFFDEAELTRIFAGRDENGETLGEAGEEGLGGFAVRSLAVDKRLLVNRKRQLKMYRRWMQAVFEKL